MKVTFHAFRMASRQLARNPGFNALVVVILALGIGASTLIYSVIRGVLLEPLPYPEADRIVRIRQLDERGNRMNPSDPNFDDLKQQSRSFSQLAQFDAYIESVAGGSEPVRVRLANVSREFLDVLGVQPVLGRPFVDEELNTGAAPAALIGYDYWQRYLGGTPEFAARPLKIGGRLHTIVGVMPPGFDYPEGSAVWAPRELMPVSPSRTGHNFQALGRLAPNVTVPQAREELGSIARRLKAQYGDDTFMSDVSVVPLHESLTGEVRPALLVLSAAVALLFVMACLNVASLLLARAVTRARELAVRVALGAERLGLARLFLSESLVLGAAGSVLGLVLAAWGLDALGALHAGALPRAGVMHIEWTAVSFAVGLAVLAAASLSSLVAWRVSSDGVLQHANRSGARGGAHSRLRDGLVASQVAMAAILLVGAALLGRSFLRVAQVDPGYRTDGAVLMSLALPRPEDADGRARLARFYEELLARLGALPGAEAVGGVSSPPLAGNGTNGGFVEQRSLDEIRDFATLREVYQNDRSRAGYAEFRIASAGYFAAMGIPVLRGRVFDDRDGQSALHSAVVSQSLAESQWPGEDPLGKLIQFGGMDGDLTPLTVVGVVGDVRDYGVDTEARPTFYSDYRQRQRHLAAFWIAIRAPDAASLIPAAREIVRSMDADLPPEFVLSEELYSATLAQRRFNLVMLAVFGGTALLLALGGLYGAIAFSVAQRTHEIGVRIAIGARASSVVRLVLRRSVWVAGIGVATGLIVALATSRLVTSLLYGVSPYDPVSYGVAASVLLLAAVVASWIPAARAARVDPLIALRHD